MIKLKKWILGGGLINRWKIEGPRLYDYLREGLQPYNINYKPIIDPFSSCPQFSEDVFHEMVSLELERQGKDPHKTNIDDIEPAERRLLIDALRKKLLKKEVKRLIGFDGKEGVDYFVKDFHSKYINKGRKIFDISGVEKSYNFKIEDVNKFAEKHGLPSYTLETQEELHDRKMQQFIRAIGPADYSYVKRLDSWTLGEACFFCMGLNPGFMDDFKQMFLKGPYPLGSNYVKSFYKNIKCADYLFKEWNGEYNTEKIDYVLYLMNHTHCYLLEMAKRAIYIKKIESLEKQDEDNDEDRYSVVPNEFVKWVAEKGFELPDELEDWTGDSQPLDHSGEAPQTIKETDPEEFVRSLTFSIESDHEIGIKVPGKPKITPNRESLGFGRQTQKKNVRWDALRGIFDSLEHHYCVSETKKTIKDTDLNTNHRVRNQEADRERKTLSAIDKKLVAFLHKEFDVNFPDQFKMFESVPNRPRRYRPKFKIVRSEHEKQIDSEYGKMSSDELIAELVECASQGWEDRFQELALYVSTNDLIPIEKLKDLNKVLQDKKEILNDTYAK